MKIGIDGTPLSFSHHCGIKHYAENLVLGLSQVDKTNEYIIFVPKKVVLPNVPNFKQVIYPRYLPFLKRQISLGRLARKYSLDIFHYLEPYGSMFFKFPKIVTTVHDVDLDKVYPIQDNPKYLLKALYCKLTRSFVIRKTKIFIAVSDYTSRELGNFLKRDRLKSTIVTIHEASAIQKVSGLKQKTKQKYLSCMGDFSPRKNIAKLFESYQKLPNNIRKNYCIIVIVSTADACKKIRDISRELGIKGNVKIVVDASNLKISKLYRNAFAFCYISTYEGFGIPPLEAMSLGCPVIASNIGSIKEVVGNAALLVDPMSSDNISKAIVSLVGQPGLRIGLINKGLIRSREFSWGKTAKKTLHVYEKLYKESCT